MASVTLAQRQVGPVTLVQLGPRLTAEMVGALHQAITTALAEGRMEFLLECEQVETVDSQGLGMLVRQWVSMERQGGKLKLVRISRRLREALQMTRLLDLIPSFDDVSHALRSF
jgi:anti-anti-sigma factor